MIGYSNVRIVTLERHLQLPHGSLSEIPIHGRFFIYVNSSITGIARYLQSLTFMEIVSWYLYFLPTLNSSIVTHRTHAMTLAKFLEAIQFVLEI